MYRYAMPNYKLENMSKAVGRSLPISTKESVEICRFIRNRNLHEAKKMLQEVATEKRSVPYRRYHHKVAHRRVGGPGRYPKKACLEILGLLESAEANAQFKGLNTANLFIRHICAHRASRQWHYGRKRSRKMKRSNVEIIVEEKIPQKKKSEERKEKKHD